MPDTPEENNHHDRVGFDVPKIKTNANGEQENWSDDKAPAKTLEQRAVAVSANHSRQVMAHRAEGGDEQINFLRTPTRLRQREQRND